LRDDLNEAVGQVGEERVITSYILRRQLSPLGMARGIQRLVEIVKRRTGKSLKPQERKKRVAKWLRLSVRTVNLYLLVMTAPPAIRPAFDRGEVSTVDVGKVALLDREARDVIKRRLKAGDPAPEVVADALAREQLRRDVRKEMPTLKLGCDANAELIKATEAEAP
jgi:hypothetical protein